MASKRINGSVRYMLRNRLAAAFKERVSTLDAKIKNGGFGDILIEHTFPSELLEAARALIGWYPRWLPTSSRFYVKIIDEQCNCHYVSLNTSRDMPIPSDYFSGVDYLEYSNRFPRYHELLSLVLEMEKINKENEAAIKEIMEIARQCTTFKQLKTAWPSVVDFIREEEI